MVKHNQTNELFECVWPFCEVGAWRIKIVSTTEHINEFLANVAILYPLKTPQKIGFLFFFFRGFNENIGHKWVMVKKHLVTGKSSLST